MMARKWLTCAVGIALVAVGSGSSACAQYIYAGPGAVVQGRVYGPFVYGLPGPTGPGPYLRHALPVPPTYVPAPGPYLYGPVVIPPARNYPVRPLPPPGSYGYRLPPYRPQVRPYYPQRPIPPYYGSQSTHPRPRRKPATDEQTDAKARKRTSRRQGARTVRPGRTGEKIDKQAEDGRKQQADPNEKTTD